MININNSISRYNYDVKMFNFREIFEKHFSLITNSKLEYIHETLPQHYLPKEKVTLKNDQSLSIYEFMYSIDPGYNLKKSINECQPGEFFKVYKKFIDHLCKSIFNEDLIYQARPTLRCHFVGNLAVGEFHRDREYNHPIEEINIWLPVTEANSSNSIQIETSINSNRFKSIDLNYGEFILFDSGLMHGNKLNDTGKTRLSFDFRVIPKSMYSENSSTKNSVTQTIPMKIGSYYSVTNNF